MTKFSVLRDENQTPVWDVPKAATADTFRGTIAANTDKTITVPTGMTVAYITCVDATAYPTAWYWSDIALPSLLALGADLISGNVHGARPIISVSSITTLHIRSILAATVTVEFFNGVS